MPATPNSQVEARLRQLEGKTLGAEAAKPRGLPGAQKYVAPAAAAYNAGADVVAPASAAAAEAANGDEQPAKKKKKDKEGKEKKEVRRGALLAPEVVHGLCRCRCCPSYR